MNFTKTTGRRLSAIYLIPSACLILLVGLILYACKKDDPAPDNNPDANNGITTTTVASKLDTPWQIAFAPDGRIFVTERPGRVRVIENGVLNTQPYINLRDTAIEAGEGGTYGIAVDPKFNENHYLYVAYTYEKSQEPLVFMNRLVRYREDVQTKKPIFDKILVDGVEGYINHNGGPVHFGPDELIYWPVGERYIPDYAQDPSKLNGKILRLTRDGGVPADNPIAGSFVYTLGHRNSQGLAWQPGTGNLFNTEHGPSQSQGCCLDEINLIEKGKNYGWPKVRGGMTMAGMETPVYYSGDTTTWAPGLAAFMTTGPWANSMVFAGLYDQSLHRAVFDPADPKKILRVETYLQKVLGRIRAVAVSPDGKLYISTSNGDGRGIARTLEDDRILIVNIAQ